MKKEIIASLQRYKIITILLVSFIFCLVLALYGTKIPEPLAKIFEGIAYSCIPAAIIYQLIDMQASQQYNDAIEQTKISQLKQITDIYKEILYDPESLKNPLSSKFTSKALKNSMSKTIGDHEYQCEITNGILSYIDHIASTYQRGHLKKYNESTILEGVKDDCYGVIKRRISYERFKLPDVLIFECKVKKSTEEGAKFVQNKNTEISWTFLVNEISKVLPENSFVIKNLKLDGIDIIPKFTETSEYIKYVFIVPEEMRYNDETPVKINYEMYVKQDFKAGFYSFTPNLPTYILNITVRLDCQNQPLYVIPHGLTTKKVPEIRDLDYNEKEIIVDDWNLPGSMIVFSWGGLGLKENAQTPIASAYNTHKY